MNVVSVVKNAGTPALRFWNKHDSTILTGITLVSSGAAVIFALRDGPKCERILREMNEKGASNVEKAKAVLPVAGRTMMALAVAWGCSVLNHKRSGDKIATLIEALSLTQSLRSDERKKMVEEVGEEKVQEVERKVAAERAQSKPVIMSEIENTGHGTFIFREPLTGKTFRASKDFVELVIGKWSRQLEAAHEKNWDDYEVSMTDIFNDIGLSRCDVTDLFVWRAIDYSSIDVNLNGTFEYEGPDGNTEPGYILDFYTKPMLGYSSYTAPAGRWR